MVFRLKRNASDFVTLYEIIRAPRERHQGYTLRIRESLIDAGLIRQRRGTRVFCTSWFDQSGSESLEAALLLSDNYAGSNK